MATEADIIRELTEVVEADRGLDALRGEWPQLYEVYRTARTYINYYDYGITGSLGGEDDLQPLSRPVYCRDCGIKMTHESELCTFAGGLTCFVCYEQFIRDVDGDKKADELVRRWNEARETE